jgi:SNF2 family DNA or RNA helicase
MQAGKIRLIDGQFTITCLPHVAIKLRRVFPGAQRQRAGMFKLAASPANAFELDWFRQRYPLDIDEGCTARFRQLINIEKRKLASLEEVSRTDYTPREFELALPPRVYQREAADRALRTRQILIADDLGVGKTVSALCALAAADTLPAIIVTMTHLTRQWEGELARFLPALSVHRAMKGTPPPAWKKKPIKAKAWGKPCRVRVPDVVVISYSKLDGWVETLAVYGRTIIFDEVQELRISDSKKYEAAAKLAAACDMRIGLSATPIYNYGSEMYSVMDVLAPGALGSWREFSQEWCSGEAADGAVTDRRKVCVSDPDALGTYLRETGLMIRRTRRDVGRELPALTVVRHVVDFDPSRINETAADIAELARRVLERSGSSLERMKWSGEIDWRMRQATGIGKAAGVADFVRLLVESGERVLLGGWHHEVYSVWRGLFEKFGITFTMFTGEESETEKEAAARAFIDGKVQVLIMSVRSGAGLDGLQKVCRTVVVGELDWSPQVIRQFIGRAHRDGQGEPTAAYILVSEEGSDPVIADVLGVKEAQAQGIRDPGQSESAHLVGRAEDHIKKLVQDVLDRYGKGKTAAPADETDDDTEAA